ncbi:MAG TPA: hypothetical protein VGN20_03685 [Mucilaginibacter sp.]|jgi:hypothetical protein
MNIFLRAKHWQIFLATFGLPFLFQIIMMVNIFSSLINNPNPHPEMVFEYFKFFPVIMLLFMGTLFGWLWSIAIGLQKFVPMAVKMKVKRFKIFFFIPIVYLFLILTFMGFIFGNVFNSNFFNNPPHGLQPDHLQLFLFMFMFIVPIHLFSMFCIFYCLYFVAKTFKTVELQKEVSFSDFIGEFFLFWFQPVGVWILQPKINKMIAEDTDTQKGLSDFQ